MTPSPQVAPRVRAAQRVALSHHVLCGASAALGLLLIASLVHATLGAFAASVASVGVIVCIAPDRAAPRRGKLWQLLPAAWIGLPLFMTVQALHARPVLLGLLLVPATFLAFLAGAWGNRGLPIVVSIMFSMIFSMAVAPNPTSGVLSSGLYFALGAGLYLVWSTASNAVLNARYRAQVLADTLASLVALMRTQASRFGPAVEAPQGRHPLMGQLLRQQAALADQLQAARNILLESPRTVQRQQWAGMLMQILEMRDHLLACELDLDTLRSRAGELPALSVLRDVLNALADDIDNVVDTLLRRGTAAPGTDRADVLNNAPRPDEPTAAALTGSLANRIVHLNDATLGIVGLARGDAPADLAVVRTAWQLFVSPTVWSWQPLAAAWKWEAPPMRHALRAALAIGTGYALSFAMPWRTHDYWILLTIVVVLRGSLAQTLERRNSRVAGTLLGCGLAAALLWGGHVPPWALVLTVTMAQGVAHAFAVRNYLVTAVAATVLGLLQSHLLGAGTSPTFDILERMADTLIGAGIAWVFSYVLPSWERGQIPSLVQRTLAAQARHAGVALGLGQLQAVDSEPELAWRLARREAHDSLSALVQATQRSLSEPRAVRPPLDALERLLAHSYQLLAQLTAVKTLLLLRRGQLDLERLRPPLMRTAREIEASLLTVPAPPKHPQPSDAGVPEPAWRPDQAPDDLSPWALRRLALSLGLCSQVRADADDVVQTLGAGRRRRRR